MSRQREKPISISVFADLEKLYREFDISTVYVKHLAKQDNEKNQIYLGSSVSSLINLLPNRILPIRHASTSIKKRKSRSGEGIIEVELPYYWLDRHKQVNRAPHTKLIDYFQYSETRMSGFLLGCKNPPDSLRRRKLDQYGQRILTFGVSSTNKILGFVLTEKNDSLVTNFPELSQQPAIPALRVFSISSGQQKLWPSKDRRTAIRPLLKDQAVSLTGTVNLKNVRSPTDLLCAELRQIVSTGWHSGMVWRPGALQPESYKATNAGGYTLEALLGIRANASRAADKYNYEIKSYSTTNVSLITTHPDSGLIVESDFKSFMERYGWPATRGRKRLVFNGRTSYTRPNPSHGWELTVTGYDQQTNAFCSDLSQINILFTKRGSSAHLMGWSFEQLLEKWKHKHAHAAYVRCKYEKNTNRYRFHETVYLCHGTDIWNFLRAVIAGVVYYDPGHSLADGKTKTRHQWRTSITPSNLNQLYESVSTETLL